jgi:hypothetical protein
MANYTIDSGVVDGKTIAQWTQEWWKWALNNPLDSNALSDTSGGLASLNNNQPVFFVAGEAFLPGPVTREFTVPLGKPLLIPIDNFIVVLLYTKNSTFGSDVNAGFGHW